MKKRKKPAELSSEEVFQMMQKMADHEVVSKRMERMAVQVITAPATFTIPGFKNITSIRTEIGTSYGYRRCPVWLPTDPTVPYNQRIRCVKYGPHTDHSDTYLIEEQTLD